MESRKLKSQSPRIHDNTDPDLLAVPPSVLDNKLRDFEEHHRVRSSIGGDTGLAVALLVPALTATFQDYPLLHLKGATVTGAFWTGFIFALWRVIRKAMRMYRADGQVRAGIIASLKNPKEPEESKKYKNHANQKAKPR